MKADEKLEGIEGSKTTNFEYLYAKVSVLQKHIEKIQSVLDKAGLKYVIEESLLVDIEDDTFKQLEEDKE